jgi:Kef-type K+ transport system membrane component KefB
LLLLGILLGGEGLQLIPSALTGSFNLLAEIALMMIGFLLGGRLTIDSIGGMSNQIAWVSISAALSTAILVAAILLLMGVSSEVAILLGCMATATAPAATAETVFELERQTPFSTLLLAVVAIDDVWALLFFSTGLAFVSFSNGAQDVLSSILIAGYEIGGGLTLGLIIGVPAAYLTGRLRSGQPLLTEALGLVFLCGGAAKFLGVSYLLAAVTMGAAIANLTRHHEYAFHEIENIEWPFMAVFFVLAGASLEFQALGEIGAVGLAYIAARTVGKIAGGWFGGWRAKAEKPVRRWIGPALLPQAGVAIGMGLVTVSEFPQYRELILPVIIGSTVVFEIVGPILTRYALRHSSEGAES